MKVGSANNIRLLRYQTNNANCPKNQPQADNMGKMNLLLSIATVLISLSMVCV